MNKYHLDTLSTSDRKIVDLTKLRIRDALLIGRYRYNSAHQKLDTHIHKGMMEICYYHKGEQVYEVNNKTYCLKGGDVFVNFPDELHGTADHPEERGVMYWLLIKMPIAGNGFFYLNKKESKPIVDALINLPVRHFRGNAKIRGILETILELTDKKGNTMQRIMLENLLISFLIQVIMDANNTTQISKDPCGNADKIYTFIMNNFKEQLTIKAMAKIINLSESRFKGWFKEEFGIPPLEFILRKRIEEAKILIKTQPILRINEIAFNLGFSSPQYFATMFKQFTSLSPKEFKATSNIIVLV